jgi:hypothetical protein
LLIQRWTIRRSGWLMALACSLSASSGFADRAYASTEPQAGTQTKTATADTKAPRDGAELIIETTSLPGTYPRAAYSVLLRLHGGVNPYHWRVEKEKGELPAGLRLEDDGTLHGTPEKSGEYRFTISVTDSGKPQQAVQREYTLNVVAAMSMRWKTPAHVVGSRIEGSVEVSNTTPDDFDLTFVVLAVNETGRATAIGYQRFPLKTGTTNFELPFGETLPHGAYVVHADGVGEVAEKNEIHRARLQTPAALQVVAGP